MIRMVLLPLIYLYKRKTGSRPHLVASEELDRSYGSKNEEHISRALFPVVLPTARVVNRICGIRWAERAKNKQIEGLLPLENPLSLYRRPKPKMHH